MRVSFGQRWLCLLNQANPRTKRTLWIFVFLSPTVIYFLIFHFLPILTGIYMSLFSGSSILGRATFVGLRNYVNIILSDRLFYHSLLVTIVYVLGSVGLSNVVGLFLALLLNQPIKGRSLIRSVLYFPQMITGVVIALMFASMMDPHVGVLNVLLAKLGLGPVRWLTSGPMAMMSIILVTTWHGMGYRMVIYLAGLQGIPQDYYEAGRVDGTTPITELIYITLPLLRDTILFNTITATIGAFQSFELPFIMTEGGPAQATWLYAYNIYQMAFSKFNLGYASALSMILFVFIFILSLLQLRLGKETLEYY